jgi:hypothetical protein
MTIFCFCNKVPGCQKLVRHTDDEMLKSVNPRICLFLCNKAHGCQNLVRHTDGETLESVNPRIRWFSATRYMAVRSS